MKLKNVVLFSAIMLFAILSCSKSSDSTPTPVDYVAISVGSYAGTVSQGTVILDTISVVISKQTSTTVLVKYISPTAGELDFAGIVVSDGGSGKASLSGKVGNTTITGVVNGKSLDCYFNVIHFVGTKP